VSNPEGTDTKTMNGFIVVSASSGPVVGFIASDSITCSGVNIQFTDLSTNCPTGWLWIFNPSTISFTNGTSQNSQNPEVIFNESGSYSVTLTVSNGSGSNSLTKQDYIHVGGISLPFNDDFESGSFDAKSWTVENPDFDITWDIATINGNLPGDKAARLNFFEYVVPPGPRDRMITPVLNFEGFNQVYLAFKHAYAKRHATVTDSLIVYISNDCGENWTRLFEAGEDGTGSFATHELMTTPFVPQTEEDWCGYGWGADCIFLDLTPWAGQENIQVAFETYNYFGNNLYIDNVSIGLMTDIRQNYSDTEILLFPNPAEGMVNIYIPESYASCSVTVYAADGSQVYQSKAGPGMLTADLSAGRNGIYFVRVQNEQVNEVRKLILK
jgi:hypothetical protein